MTKPNNTSDSKIKETTSPSTATTNQVLKDSNESHLVEDRALERLGRLLSASASIFSSRVDVDDETKEASKELHEKLNDTMVQNNNNEDVMSTSDTSSHLWQGISGNMNFKMSKNGSFKVILPITQSFKYS